MRAVAEILRMKLDLDPGAPRRARLAVAEHLTPEVSTDDLLLCVSEVVTNAIRHARSPWEMRVSQRGTTVRVEVHDADERPPVLLPPDPTAHDGRGLQILDHLAARWGSRPTRGGKTIWFELDL